MTPNPLYVRRGDLATKVRAIFRRSKFKGLPVVDENTRVRGLITVRDMLRITSTKSNLTAEGIMGPPSVYLTPDETLLGALKKMIKAGVDRAVVVDSPARMQLLGVISMHDFVKAIQKTGKPIMDVPIETLMTKKVVTCTPKDPVTMVWRKMEESDVTGLPVIDKKVVGMVTRSDVVASGFARIRKESEQDFPRSSTAVEKVMSTPAVTVSPKARVGEAMRTMVSRNIGRLPVADKGRLVGIIDREDILKQFLEVSDA